MALLGDGVAAIWHDIAVEDEPEYHHWHCHEHIPERVSIPGFLRGRRYAGIAGAPRFFHFYETESLATLTSPAYGERLNHPTPWTQRVVPSFRGTNRTLCEVILSQGLGQGAAILTLRTGTEAGREQEFRRWLGDELFPALIPGPGVVAAHLLRGDDAASRSHSDTREKAMSERRDEVADWVIFVEAIEASFLTPLRRSQLSDTGLATHGASAAQWGIYQLHYGLTSNECAQVRA